MLKKKKRRRNWKKEDREEDDGEKIDCIIHVDVKCIKMYKWCMREVLSSR